MTAEAPTEPARPKRRPRWRWIALGVAALGVVGALVAGFFVLRTLEPERLRPLVLGLLDGALAGEFRAGRIELGLDGRIEIDDLDLADRPSGAVVLGVASLRARCSLLSAVRGAIRCSQVELSGVRLDLDRRAADGGLALVAALGSKVPSTSSVAPSAGGSLTIELEDVHLAGLDLDTAVGGVGVHVRAEDLAPLRVVRTSSALEVDVSAPRVALSLRGGVVGDGPALEVIAAPLALRYAWDATGARVRLGPTVLEIPGAARLEVGGRLDDLPPPGAAPTLALGLRGTVQVEAPAWRRFVPEAVLAGLSGPATVVAEVTGTAPAIALRLELSAPRLARDARALEDVRLTLRIDGDRVALESVGLRLGEGGIDGELMAHGTITPTLALDAELVGVVPRALVDAPPDLLPSLLDGHLSLTRGSTQAPLRARFDVIAADLPARVPVALPAPVRARGSITLSGAWPGQVALSAGGLEATLAGNFAPDALALTVESRLDEVSAILRDLGVPAGAHGLRVRGTVGRTPTALSGRLYVSLARLDLGAEQSLSVAADVELLGDGVAIEALTATGTAGRLAARGRVRRTATGSVAVEGLVLDARSLGLGALTKGLVDGRATLRARLDGSPATLRGDATLVLDDIAAFGLHGGGELSVSITDGRAALTPTTLSFTATTSETPVTLRVAGTADVRALDLSLDLAGLPLGPLLRRLAGSAYGLDGVASARLRVHGAPRDPMIELQADVPVLAREAVDLGHATLTLSGPRSAVEARAALNGAAIEISAHAQGPLVTGVGRGEILVRKLVVTPELATSLFGRALGFTTSGTVAVERDAQARLQLGGELRLSELLLGETAVALPPLTVRLSTGTEDRQRVELALGTGPETGHLFAELAIDLRDPARFDAHVELQDLALTPLFEALELPELSARATARAELSRGPGGLAGQALFEALTIGVGDARFGLVGPARVVHTAGRTTLDRLELAGPRSLLRVRAALGEAIDLDAEGTLDLGLLPAFVPALARAEGLVAVKLTARGPLDAPDLSGRVAIASPVTLRPRGQFRELVLRGGAVVAAGESLQLEAVSGSLGTGVFSLDGDVRLSGLRPSAVDLTITAEDFPLRTRELDAEGLAELRLRGPLDALVLSGRVEIVRARYRKKLRLNNFRLVAAESEDPEGPLPFSDLELALDVSSSAPIRVEVDAGSIDARLDLDVDLRVAGTVGDPRFEGRVGSSGGRLRFPAAKLDVVSASADFAPQGRAEDRLRVQLRAEGEVESRQTVDLRKGDARFVTVTVEGPPDALSIELVSEGLDRLEVLALLITGQTQIQSLTAGDRALDSALAFAGAQLATPVTAFLEDQLERQLNLDLKLGAELSTRGFRVSAEKEFTRRIVVEGSYARTFDDAQASTTSVRALLWLLDRVFLEASTTSTRKATPLLPTEIPTTTRIELKYQILGP